MNGSMNEVKHPVIPGGFSKRNVIIQRDEFGFGLTVSGDNPVYVQSVKDGSAAAKAGVLVGDQIMKVNGSLVTQSNHIEVVTLIKSGSYVALTLLGKDNSSKSPTETRVPRIGGGGHIRSKSLTTVNIQNIPNQQPFLPPYNDVIKTDRVTDVERTLNQEREYNKTILEKYRRAPSPKTQKKLAESKTRITALEKQLQVLSGNYPVKSASPVISPYRPITQPIEARESPTSPHSADFPISRSSSSSSSSHISIGSHPPLERAVQVDEHIQLTNLVSSSTPNLGHMNEIKRSRMEPSDIYEGPRHTPIEPVAEELSESLPEPLQIDNSMFVVAQRDTTGKQYKTDDIFSMEDEEFSSDEDECLNNHGPFERLELLKDKKAHLAVFLHYLISNSDPTPLFFWVVTEIYSKETKTDTVKEWKKWAYEVYSTFVAPSAPLKVDIGGEMEEKNIAEALNDPRTTDDRLRDIFSVARSRLECDLEMMLNEFRMKRSIGLGGLFGDRQLEDNMDRAAELRIVETTLMPHLDTLLGECESSNDIQSDKNIAMASAIATLMKSAGLGKVSGGKGTSLEKCRSFAEKEKSPLINWRGKRAKSLTHMGHQFVFTQYSCITLCNICNGLLWGIGTQGLQCQDCKFNVHRKSCKESIKDMCIAKKRIPRSRPTQDVFPPKEPANRLQKPDEEKPMDSGIMDPSDQRIRVSSLNDDKPGPKSDNDLDEPAPDSGKDSDSRPGTPFEEPATTPTQKSKTMGYRQRKVATKNVHRSNSEKTMRDIKSASKVKIPGVGGDKKTENGVIGPSPSPSNPDSPPPDSGEDTEDSDLKVETEVIAWSTVADKKIIKKLKPKEIKRQEVIHELLHTEKTHVRNLKILDKIFHRKIRRSNTLSSDEIKRIFPNLEELIGIHESLLKTMKERENSSVNEVIENIGDIMLNRFDGEAGEEVKQACATFCRHQSIALKEWTGHVQNRKEFATLMTKLEENPYCRRLKFAAILSSTHQRLVKYPMLLDSLNKVTPAGHSDYKNVEKSSRCCKDILNHVNDEIKRVEDDLRLKYLATRIEDKRNIREDDVKPGEDPENENIIGKFNILNHSLILEGDLIWKVNANRRIDLHVILLNDTLVLLTKQDDKFILKTHNTSTTDNNRGHSPLIPLSSALIREVATDKKAFFLVSTSMKTPQIYELIAQTYTEKRLWVERIHNANERNKGRIVAARGRRDGLHLPGTTSPTIAPSPNGEEEEKTSGKEKDSENSEGVLSDEEDKPSSPSSPSSPVPEEESTDKLGRPPLSKERMEELNDELNRNHSDMMKLITKRSTILSELQGEKYSESLLTNINQPRDLVVRAMAHAEQLNQVFCQCSAEDQRENYFAVHHQLGTIFGDLLDAVTSENRHDSYTDTYDGKELTNTSKRTSSKADSVEYCSLQMHSMLDETTPASSPPPILVSDSSIEQQQDQPMSESPKKNEDVILASNDFVSPARSESFSRNDTHPKQGESGLLITSPFKIHQLRKRISDPGNESASNLHPTQHTRAASFNQQQQSESSDSES